MQGHRLSGERRIRTPAGSCPLRADGIHVLGHSSQQIEELAVFRAAAPRGRRSLYRIWW